MTTSVFITGTDTEVGKTFVSCQLLKAFEKQGLTTAALKPIASGCQEDGYGQLINDDARQLKKHATLNLDINTVNPIRFAPPIAPHIAAEQINTPLTKKCVVDAISHSIQANVDINLIEGAGGWAVPLNQRELFCEVILEMNLPIILVVGIKLGCLNHALLSYQAITKAKGRLIGWVANCVQQDSAVQQENIATLRNFITAPFLGQVHHNAVPETQFDIDTLRKGLFHQMSVAG